MESLRSFLLLATANMILRPLVIFGRDFIVEVIFRHTPTQHADQIDSQYSSSWAATLATSVGMGTMSLLALASSEARKHTGSRRYYGPAQN